MKKQWILLEDQFKSDVLLKLGEIINYLSNMHANNNQYGLFTGDTGVALLMYYYSKFTENKFYANKGMDFISSALNGIDNKLYHPFCGGISGICWCIDHLINQGFISKDSREILDVFDKNLSVQSLQNVQMENYDFLHGAIGTSTYLLNRVKYSNFVEECEINIIDMLYKSRIIMNNSCAWTYKIGNKFNISLSHGMSSMCIFLCKAYEFKINTLKSKQMAEEGIRFLLKQEKPNHEISMFPSFNLIPDKNNEAYLSSRLGWCYGDMGIALALWQYSQTFHDEKIAQKAIEIFLFSAKRRNLNQNMIIDASICHGTAGLALMFKKLYIRTQQNEFKDASLYWLNQTLNMAKFSDGIAGYKSNDNKCSIDFLNGVAGIGLVFLSFLLEEDTKWEECLLLF